MSERGDAPPVRPHVAIVTAVFNEEGSLALYERTVREVLLSRTDYNIGVLFVDDGSEDRSWEIICDICRRDPRFPWMIYFSKMLPYHKWAKMRPPTTASAKLSRVPIKKYSAKRGFNSGNLAIDFPVRMSPTMDGD